MNVWMNGVSYNKSKVPPNGVYAKLPEEIVYFLVSCVACNYDKIISLHDQLKEWFSHN
jgi:hypothetical protein